MNNESNIDLNKYPQPNSSSKNEKENNENCLSCVAFFFQAIIWISIILLIIGVIINSDNMTLGGGIALGVSYLIYIILEFCSPICKYLMNINTDQRMYEKMGKLFITPPVINFYAECYHYYTHHYTTRDSKGRIQHHSERRKVVTHRDSYDLPYYSFKDVSGLFLLNLNQTKAKQKVYIKLYLKKEINFSDPISYSDYINQKDLFWRRNRYLDSLMHFSETRYIPGMKEYNLVKIGTYEPKFFGLSWYILSVFLTIGGFYRKYFNSFCISQTFKIRKLISTRYNLLEPQYIQQYQPLMPQLNIIGQQYNYEPQNTGYCSNDVQPLLPTKEEIEQAEKYQDQIPNYGITSNGGVIQDIPQFNDPNYNIPPPAFVSVGGDVNLNQNEIKPNQNIPMNHEYINGDFNGNVTGNNPNDINGIQAQNIQNNEFL